MRMLARLGGSSGDERADVVGRWVGFAAAGARVVVRVTRVAGRDCAGGVNKRLEVPRWIRADGGPAVVCETVEA